MTSIFSRTLVTGVTVVLLVGCGHELSDPLQSGKVHAWHGLQGRWIGPVTPTAPSCGSTTQGLLSIGENGFGFDPFQSTTIIDGTVDPDGHLNGKLVRPQPGVSISFTAAAGQSGTEPEAITGTLQSSRCQWQVTLHRG